MSKVEYKIVRGFPNYRVGTDGSIWSRIPKGKNGSTKQKYGDWRLLRPPLCKGYPRTILRKNNKSYPKFVHHLVLEAFIGPRPKGMECRHFPDPTRNNNNLNNISWSTKKTNQADKVTHGTSLKGIPKKHLQGSKNHRAKLTEHQVLEIRRLCAEKILTRGEIAAIYNVTGMLIHLINTRKIWKHI